MGPNEALVTKEGHGAAKLEAVTKSLSVHRHARVRAFVMPER